MTIPRLTAIVAHWERVPPASVSLASIAAALGARSKPAQSAAAAQPAQKEQNRQALFEALGGQGFSTEKPAWLKAAQATT